MFAVLLLRSNAAHAVAMEPGERFHVRMVTPVENNTGFRVWGSKYYPNDVLSQKMEEYFFRKLNEIPRVTTSKVTGLAPEFWANSQFSPYDLVIKLELEQFDYKKKDTLGSKVFWDVAMHLYVYNGSTGRVLYESIVEEKDSRLYPLYNDVMETGPIYWDMFEKSPYWPAIRKTLDGAFTAVMQGYNGYRVVGQIVAKAERVDGSLTASKRRIGKMYHVNIGREDSAQVGDIFVVTRASSVRTIAPDTPEMHFPQVVGRVRVIFIKGQDAIVEIVKESSDAPIQLGDSISAPLHGKRDGKKL